MQDFVALDCEVYPNYFLAAFKNADNGKTITIEAKHGNPLNQSELRKLKTVMHKRTTFGFNSLKYDIPIILYALSGKTTSEIHQLSDYIIGSNDPYWAIMNRFQLTKPDEISHFDISEPTPGVMVSLKLYGGRLHSKRLQDLPIEPGTELTEQEMEDTKLYCINDLDTTIDLFNRVRDRIQLRIDMSEKYGEDLRSKSDAQIAETVIKSVLAKKYPRKAVRRPQISGSATFQYHVPDYIGFESPQLKEALEFIRTHRFELDGKGSIKLPRKLSQMKIELGYSTYKLGIGGIHSTESAQTVVPNSDELLCDRDVASYYPAIILNLGLYPKHLGPVFLSIYQDIVDERLFAKRSGNKIVNESLKIVINGSFGKLGNKYSILYSPDLMIAVTLTGQLALLMLIERLEKAGVSVVSANTDGFVSILSKDLYEKYDDICFQWELDTGFELEETQYKALYSRDVNNYLAVTDYGTKGKGIFSKEDLKKNPAAKICITAVEEFLVNGTPVGNTITNCKEIEPFLTVRTVNGGAIWKDQYLGRVVRWIYSTNGDKIVYKKNGNKVPKSDDSRPIMELSEFPTDIDYKRYIAESYSILKDIGS